MATYNFCIPKHTQQLWQKISLHWSHHNHPHRQRFLGSVQIRQEATNQVLGIVGDNLRNLGIITYNKLYERFNEPEQNWLKILTFALSEYAYYYSSVEEKFWYGFCERLQLSCNQGVERTLRRIVGEGFEVLGLVRAKGGYNYVSSLWLQSGIPQQNLSHFAQLVQEFSNEYGWWEIAHTSCEDISEELFDFCLEKHPQWGTLNNFLKASCSQKEKEEVEFISGQLLQGIATVAVELERQGTLPEELKNDNEREQLLGNYYLPNNFFLRNWDSLIQVLTPKQRRQGSSRRIISRRQKPLSLVLDVADSLNMQLVLPEQNLWKKGWERLAGTFCKIPELYWEGTIPTSPELIIPEQIVNIEIVSELWKQQLLDHRGNCLIEWKLEGVTNDLPCLIFDAWTGARLNLDSINPSIRGTKEIICFTPRDTQLNFGNGIEITDSCVPSSLQDWQGQQLILTNKESSINLYFNNTNVHRLVSWTLLSEEQPILKGLQLKGKKSVYLEIPSFWHPPVNREISLNISIEDIKYQQIIINTSETIQASDKWSEIPLNKWIKEPGKYEARFWNQSYRWSYQFEVKSNYQITSKPDIHNLNITGANQSKLDKLPIPYNCTDKFWAEEIKIEGLFPLEIINLSLSDKQETVFSQCQADSLGNLHINLAAYYDFLSTDSNYYALDYQRLGRETQRLIEMVIAPLVISCTWSNQAVYISGLLSEEIYSLLCWNLLLPKNPLEIKIPLILNEDTITVPLEVPPGIYHIRLVGRKLQHNLGWWCGSNQYDLPEEVLQNEDLENYWYTILDNDPVNDFIKAANKFDYDSYFLETAFHSLTNLPCHFPEWLKISSLIEKLQALVKNLKVEEKTSIYKPEIEISDKNPTNQKKWFLIRLTKPKKRDLILKLIQINIERNSLQKEINIHIPKQPFFNDIFLLECQNANDINYIKDINYINYLELGNIQRPESLTFSEAQQILKA